MKKYFAKKSKTTISLMILLCWTLAVFMPGLAYPWGSLAPAKTHQYICQEAYKKLSADPAFDPLKFPSLEEILNNEGVVWARYQWTGEGYIGLGVDFNVLKGNGPDSKGASKFSEHYYNPRIKSDNKGGAPAAVAKYYKYLAEGGTIGKKEVLPKAAAWGAHFLADMFCPYHVNGSDRATIQAIYNEQNADGQKGVINLENTVKGSSKLSYFVSSPIKSLSDNFNTEVTRFLTKSEEDWFDPWYYNGYVEQTMSETSSHIAWETTINHSGEIPFGYSKDWKNAPTVKNFTAPWTSQAEKVKLLAIASAEETSNNIDSYFDKPYPAINNAVQAVATLWRASITAINPSIETTQPAEFILVKGKIVNKGDVNLTDAEIKLTTSGCNLASWNDSQKLGTIPAGGSKMTEEIKVRPSNLPCNLKLQVVAGSTRPDLQYAEAETTIAPKKEEKKAVVTDSPVGSEEAEAMLRGYGKPRFLNPQVKITEPIFLEMVNVSSAQCVPEKVKWEGSSFSLACQVKYNSNFYPKDTPYTSIQYRAGQHSISMSGSIDETRNVVKNIQVKATWTYPPESANYCWDLKEPMNSMSVSYAVKDVPFHDKYNSRECPACKDRDLYFYYTFQLPLKDFPGKLSGLSYSTRICLHPGQTFDTTEIDTAKEPGEIKIRFMKRMPDTVPTKK